MDDGRMVDQLRVEVHADGDALARRAADEAASCLRTAVAARGVAHAMFATGNSQLRFVETLVSSTDGVPWSDMVIFHMDEYVGVGPDHSAGFQRWIRERIVDRTSPRAAHYLDGLADPQEECRRYGALLESHPLDLCCLGIGENGHLAFNDPPVADFADPLDVKVVELESSCRAQQVHEGHFPTIDDVPSHAMTVTIPALLRAGTVLAIVPEARKAEPVRLALQGPIAPTCPASALRLQAECHLAPRTRLGRAPRLGLKPPLEERVRLASVPLMAAVEDVVHEPSVARPPRPRRRDAVWPPQPRPPRPETNRRRGRSRSTAGAAPPRRPDRRARSSRASRAGPESRTCSTASCGPRPTTRSSS